MGTPTKNIAMLAKLVLLAAVLSAVALAAPTTPDTVVPEEMVQTALSSESAEQVADLKAQFEDLKTLVQSGSAKTAAVMRVISRMIDLVDNEIVNAINGAHKQDQKSVKDSHKVITDYNAAIAKYEKDVSDKTDTCCDKHQAAKEATEYTPAYATCDYTSKEAAKCTDVAKANAHTAVSGDFAHGLQRYRDLKAGCATMTTLIAADLEDYNNKNEHCDDSQAECITQQGAIATRKAAFDK